LNSMTGVVIDGKLVLTWGVQSDVTERVWNGGWEMSREQQVENSGVCPGWSGLLNTLEC
jgi:hypothetical protein